MPWAHTQCTYDWATWYWRDRMTGLWLRTAPMTPHDTPRPSSCVLACSTDICFDGLNLLCLGLLHLQKHRTSPVGRRLESAGSLVKRYSWVPPQSACCSRNWHFQQVFWWCHCRWFRDHTFRTTGLVKTTQDGNWSTGKGRGLLKITPCIMAKPGLNHSDSSSSRACLVTSPHIVTWVAKPELKGLISTLYLQNLSYI